MSKSKRFKDFYIREVRVNYLPTTKAPFKILAPNDVATFVRSILTDNSREHFVALYLNAASNVVSYSIISIGTANSALVHPREVFQRAIKAGAHSIVIAHNHPTGEIKPSKEDDVVTRKLKAAGDLLGILLLDHVIVSEDSAFSYKEDGNWSWL